MGRGCDPFLFVLATLIPPILAFLVGFLIWQAGLGQYLAFGAIMYLMTSMGACAYAMTRHG